jgi:hypothetical protein
MNPPPVPGQKKKMSPWAWVAIGCGAIAILGILAIGMTVAAGGWFLKKQVDKFEENPAIAAAELAVRANPDVELVKSDPDNGTITYRDKKTGEEVTVNAEEIQEGKWSVTTKEGTATFDATASGEGGTLKVTTEKGEETTFTAGANVPKNLPDWLPTYPGGKVEGSFDATTTEGRSAMFAVTTSGTVDEVAEFYESRLKSAGLTVERASYEAGGQRTVTLVGKTGDEKRTVTVGITNTTGQTQASVQFAEKN